MTRHLIAGMVVALVGCGDDGGPAEGPDAALPLEAHGVQFDVGPNNPDVVVFSSDPDGRARDVVRANADGIAELEVVEGGMVSFVDGFWITSMANVGPETVLTWRGWRDEQAVAEPTTPLTANVAAQDSADRYDVFGCESQSRWNEEPGAITVGLTAACAAADEVPVFAFAIGANQLLAYATAAVDPAAVGETGAELEPWSEEWEDVAVAVTAPDGGSVWGSLELRAGPTYLEVPQRETFGGMLQRPPGASEIVGYSLSAYSNGGSTSFVGPAPLPAGPADWLSVPTPATLGGLDTANPSVVWRSTGEGDAVTVLTFFEDTDGEISFYWNAVGSPVTDRLTVPELPEEARASLGLDATSTFEVTFAFINVVDFDGDSDHLELAAEGRLDVPTPGPSDPHLLAGATRRTGTAYVQP